MPIVPAGNLVKSIATASSYTPVSTFNPDKKEIFKTETTTLGLLGGDCTTDGTQVTVPAGLAFIQNGIVVRLTSAFVLSIPAIAFPKLVVANNDNENAGSPVTIEIKASATAPEVVLATLDPDNSTITSAPKISIRALHDRINTLALSAPEVDVLKDGSEVVANATDINLTGPNISVANAGSGQADVGVTLDVEDDGSGVTTKTKKINFTGPSVTVTADPDANSAKVAIDPVVEVKDEGVSLGSVKKLNFTGSGVAASIDGVDPTQANIDVTGGASSALQDQWIGQVGQFGILTPQGGANVAKAGIYEDAFISTSGSAVVGFDSGGLKLTLNTGVALSTEALLFSGDVHRRDVDSALLIKWRMGPSLAAHRFFVGFTSQTPSGMVSSDDPSGHYVGLIKGVADVNWSFVSKDGTTQNKQVSTVAVDSAPHYVRIVINSAVPNALVELYDANFALQASFTFTVNLPGATTAMKLLMAVQNQDDGTSKDVALYYGRGRNKG